MHSTLRGALLALALGGAATAAVSGQSIYQSNCAGCHGAKAQGGVGPSLHEAGGWSYALFSRAMLKDLDDHGQKLKAPMPWWGKVGFMGDGGKPPSAAEIRALQAYIKTLK